MQVVVAFSVVTSRSTGVDVVGDEVEVDVSVLGFDADAVGSGAVVVVVVVVVVDVVEVVVEDVPGVHCPVSQEGRGLGVVVNFSGSGTLTVYPLSLSFIISKSAFFLPQTPLKSSKSMAQIIPPP